MGTLGEYVDGGIDPSQHEPSHNFTPLPPGSYPVEIESVEIKDTKAGTGKYLKVQYNVIGEDYNGRKLFDQINILNPSEKAQEIGRRQLADLARACDIPFLDDEDMLIGKQLEVRVKVKQEKDREPDNEIKGYKPLGGGAQTEAPAKQAAPPAQKQAAAPAAEKKPAPEQQPKPKSTGGKMPWEW